MKRNISRLLVGLTFIFILTVMVKRFDLIKENFHNNGIYFLLIALIYLGGRFMDGLRLKFLLEQYDLKLKKSECMGLSCMMPCYNIIFPNAGILTNATYLKAKHKFKYTHFLSVGVFRTLITILMCCVVGLVSSLIYSASKGNNILFAPCIIYIGLILLAVMIYFVPIPAFLRKYSILDKLSKAVEGMRGLGKNKTFLIKMVLAQMGIVTLFILRYYVVFKALSFSVPLLNVSSILPMTALSNIVNILPANFAIREIMISTSSVLIGLSRDDGLIVAALDRAVILATLLFAGTISFIKLKYFNHIFVKLGNFNDISRECDDE